MRKIILFIGVIALLYLGGVFFRAQQWESETEDFLEEALIDIAQPWSTERLESRASLWFREKSRLRPLEIVNLVNQDFGNLVEITGKPECNIQQGFDAYSKTKNTYAVCVANIRMERKKVVMEIRLIHESGGWKINDFISIK